MSNDSQERSWEKEIKKDLVVGLYKVQKHGVQICCSGIILKTSIKIITPFDFKE